MIDTVQPFLKQTNHQADSSSLFSHDHRSLFVRVQRHQRVRHFPPQAPTEDSAPVSHNVNSLGDRCQYETQTPPVHCRRPSYARLVMPLSNSIPGPWWDGSSVCGIRSSATEEKKNLNPADLGLSVHPLQSRELVAVILMKMFIPHASLYNPGIALRALLIFLCFCGNSTPYPKAIVCHHHLCSANKCLYLV